METILIETNDQPFSEAQRNFLLSLGLSIQEEHLPIRRGDTQAYGLNLPSPWADRPELDKKQLREIAWTDRK